MFNAWDVDVLVNKASSAALTTPKLDWSTFAVTAGIALPDFTAAGTDSVDLDESLEVYARGSVSFDALSGMAVGTGSFELTLGTLYGVDAQGVPVSGARRCTGQAVVVTLTNVDLWVGTGGALADTGTNDFTDATTFSDDTVVEGDWALAGTWARCSWCR